MHTSIRVRSLCTSECYGMDRKRKIQSTIVDVWQMCCIMQVISTWMHIYWQLWKLWGCVLMCKPTGESAGEQNGYIEQKDAEIVKRKQNNNRGGRDKQKEAEIISPM